jgi:hypothetical protein
MRSPRKLLIAAGLLVLVGLAVVIFDNDSYQGYSIGNLEGSAPYSSELSVGFDGAWLVSTQALLGYALVWLGSMLAAGAVGFRRATARSASV